MKYRISHVHFGHVHFGFLAAAVFAFCAAGCNSQTATPDASQTEESHDGHAHHDHGSHDHGDHAHGEGGNTEQALAKLSPADRAAIEKQKTCPVSGDELLGGSMGAPIKVLVSGREVWICCEGCRESLEEDPDEYLAKLPK